MDQRVSELCRQTNSLFITYQSTLCSAVPSGGFEYAHDFVNNGCCYLWAALVKARLNQSKIRSSIVGQPSHVYLRVGKHYYDSFLWTGTDNALDISENAIYLDYFSDYGYRKLNRLYDGALHRKASLLKAELPTTEQVWHAALQSVINACNQ